MLQYKLQYEYVLNLISFYLEEDTIYKFYQNAHLYLNLVKEIIPKSNNLQKKKWKEKENNYHVIGYHFNMLFHQVDTFGLFLSSC